MCWDVVNQSQPTHPVHQTASTRILTVPACCTAYMLSRGFVALTTQNMAAVLWQHCPITRHLIYGHAKMPLQMQTGISNTDNLWLAHVQLESSSLSKVGFLSGGEMTDSLRVGRNWPETSERLTILVIVGTRKDEYFLRSQVGIGSESDCLFGQLDRILRILDSEAGVKT